MEWEWFFINFLKIMFIITSPVTFLVGIFLIFDVATYQKIEKFLSKSYGDTNNFIKNLEHNRESFQIFLLERRRLVGVTCIINSFFAIIIAFFTLKGQIY
jgi:hypothetical protein